jgi:long-subunit acyl-CoA synthetase (AMP-forming)
VVLAEDTRAQLRQGGKAAIEAALSSHLEKVNAGLDHVEQLQFVSVVSDEWTAENGFLTPTLKIKRSKIEEAYRSQVAGWYAQNRKVVWSESRATR